MARNKQLPTPADYDASGNLKIHSIFPTIQGEGPFCGERALFFRLHGCNLRCPGCDTDYTSSVQHVTPGFMATKAAELGWAAGDLVVITGGEPFRQNVAPSIRALLRAGYVVQVETNGVLWPDDMRDIAQHEHFHIVCSPKTSRIHDSVYQNAAAFKYVIKAGFVDEDTGLPTRALDHAATPHVARPRPGALVYVQPMDEEDTATNAMNLAAAIRSVMLHGHRLQLQIHKICNLE